MTAASGARFPEAIVRRWGGASPVGGRCGVSPDGIGTALSV